MSYAIKKIKGKELAEFFLNPFERSACFNDTIIQKYSRSLDVDDFICIDIYRNRALKTGFILYEKQEIIIERIYVIDSDELDHAPFVKISDLKKRIREMVGLKLEQEKTEKLDEIKKSKTYTDLKDKFMKEYFEAMVFSKLGTTYYLSDVESCTIGTISRFVNDLSDEEFVLIASGGTEPIDKCVKEIIESSNFIAADIIQPEIKKEVNEYIAAGKFSNRELILKDYLEKTKASGAQRFTVETFSGQKVSCRNEVSQDGNVVSTDGLSFIIDVEEIRSVKYCNKVIYKKI